MLKTKAVIVKSFERNKKKRCDLPFQGIGLLFQSARTVTI